MTKGPDFVSQNGEALTSDLQRKWVKRESSAMLERGATWLRATVHPSIADLIVVEGWKTRPKESAEAHFALINAGQPKEPHHD